RYEYTLDHDWLQERAYPMLKAAAEFYRNFPNLQKEADGKFHIHYTNSNESVWGGRDSDEDLCAMRGVMAAAIGAAQVLDEDPARRGALQNLVENVAPPANIDEGHGIKPDAYNGSRVWVGAQAGGKERRLASGREQFAGMVLRPVLARIARPGDVCDWRQQ